MNVTRRAMWHIYAQEFLQSPKVGTIVAALTTGSGAVTVLDAIPESVDRLYNLAGVFGLVCGGILSLTMAWVHWRRWRLEKKRYDREHRKPD